MKDNLVPFRPRPRTKVPPSAPALPLVELLQLLAFSEPLAIVAVREWVTKRLDKAARRQQ